MVPRSYQYQSTKPTHTRSESEKGAVAVAVKERSSKTPNKHDKIHSNGRPNWLSSVPVATPSKPVVIPTRTRAGVARRTKEPSEKSRRASGEAVCHDFHSVPSSEAALLAMTSGPDPRCQAQTIDVAKPRYALRNPKRQGRRNEPPRHSMSIASPKSWNVLLSSPDELDPQYSSFGSDTTLDAGSIGRSLSTDSIPSLDEDSGSLTSPPNSVPSTPGLSFRSRSGYERRAKEQSSKVEDCVLDHPLLAPRATDEPVPDEDDAAEVSESRVQGLSKSASVLRSNLSASLALLRSAARSISNFTAPAISRDEYLARSLLSINPPFTDERRPLPMEDPPDPALRRYLNPITVSPSELHMHNDHPQPPSDRDRCTASIQLQSYKRVSPPSDKASAPPIFVSSEDKFDAAIVAAAEEPLSTPGPRQREPRENSDFLRVIVLEMNMRRNGQLGEGVPGKARMSLPARQAGKKEVMKAVKSTSAGRRVPRRWVGIGAY